MAQIVINEVSQNYTYNIGTNSFATVALPITSCWGPGFFDPESAGMELDDMLEHTAWERFPATQAGLESFVSTYRGPAANYRLTQDYSYQMAMTLLTAGYDILTCRLSPGSKAQGAIKCGNATLHVQAKYPGTFGNTLRVEIKRLSYRTRKNEEKYYWNIITSIIDESGIKTSVENLTLVFDIENATDTILYYDEIDSKFITLSVDGGTIKDSKDTEFETIDENIKNSLPCTDLSGGSDKSADPVEVSDEALLKYYTGVVEDNNAEKILANLQDKLENADTKEDAQQKLTAILDTLKVAEPDVAAVLSAVNAAKYDLEDATQEEVQPLVDNHIIPTEPVVDEEGQPTGEEKITDSGKYIQLLEDAVTLAEKRYAYVADNSDGESKSTKQYISALMSLTTADPDPVRATNIKYLEWLYTYAVGVKIEDGTYQGVYDLLKDKLTYNPNRIISPGWDDQNIMFLKDEDDYVDLNDISPLIWKLLNVAYYSRCATALIDIPRSLKRACVYNESIDEDEQGYVQKIARTMPTDAVGDVNGTLYHSHSAIFGPWGRYTYVGTGKQAIASPSFLALMIQRAQILNQANQYEWALPTNRRHNLRIGKMDYNVSKKYLDQWQKLEGVGVNVITAIPDLGTNIWGNSTLFEVPPATYQALANLSTRYLVNAVENVIYRVGIGITFSYNNEQAYNKFYAGVTPILDTMKNVGAIDDYYVKMSADINGLDQVNANTVIGKVYLVVNGVINDIVCDLIALPPGVDLNQFKA